MALKLHNLVFNSFSVNTYILEAENGDCIIVDAACSNSAEQTQLENFLKEKNITPIMQINTHTHIDHILGCDFVKNKFNIPWYIHEEAQSVLREAPVFASLFGIKDMELPKPDGFVEENQEIKLGNNTIKILHTPGHAPGSICLYVPDSNMVITGDVLFNGSIGRTDLVGGDYETLINQIKSKLLVLPDETIVYPGHGPKTSIYEERENNPYL